MNPYTKIVVETQEDAFEVLNVIVRERRQDIKDFDNLQNRFISGRSTGKIPVSAADVAATDKLGDVSISYATGYQYVLVNNAGTAVWARILLDTTW